TVLGLVREGGGAGGVLGDLDLELGAAADGGDGAERGLLPLHGHGEDVAVGVRVVAGDREHHARTGTHAELVVVRGRGPVLLVPLGGDVRDRGGEGLLLLLLGVAG